MKEETNIKTIVLFDGHCNLCNSSVQFILRHEKASELYFASLQSDIGISLLNQYGINTQEIDSLVLIENNKAYTKSSAALRILKYLKGLYPIGFGFIIIPSFIRNLVYDFIAKNRYKWFGKSESCMMLDKSVIKRFL